MTKPRDVLIVKADGTKAIVRLSDGWTYMALPTVVNIPRLSPTGVALERYCLTGNRDDSGRPIYK